MGYVHDTAMSQFIPPTAMVCITGTWTEAAGAVAGTIAKHCAAADESTDVYIPITIPSNSVASKGAYLKSIEVDYEIVTAACDTVTPVIHKMTRGADGADVVVAQPAFTYDAGHDTDDERDDLDEHKMTLTITTPFWLDNDEYVWLAIAFDKAATSTVEFLGAVANYTLRL